LGGNCGGKPLGSRRGRVRINEPWIGGICGGKPLGSCLGKVLIGGPWFGGGGKKFIYNLYKYLNYIYHGISKYKYKFCIIKNKRISYWIYQL
jgi:hypothetical protein